jgi:plasmid maintenance system antidote protein VapI
MKSLRERINDTLNSVEAEIERAKIEFTEELLAQMEAQGISRTALAKSLGVKPARITALLRGSNNFTLETMVRICRAVGAKYTHYIQPRRSVSKLCPLRRTGGCNLVIRRNDAQCV